MAMLEWLKCVFIRRLFPHKSFTDLWLKIASCIIRCNWWRKQWMFLISANWVPRTIFAAPSLTRICCLSCSIDHSVIIFVNMSRMFSPVCDWGKCLECITAWRALYSLLIQWAVSDINDSFEWSQVQISDVNDQGRRLEWRLMGLLG